MLVGPISSSLFTLASKRNRVRVGYEKDWFCASCCFNLVATFKQKTDLVAPIFSYIPPTRFILEPLVGGTEKPLFFCVLFRKKRVISQCLLLMNLVKNSLSGAPRHEG